MLFNSIDFAIFLPTVLILYWFVFNKSLKAQNFLIVVASYLFYGLWDWKFLFLILLSTVVDYSIGLLLKKENHLTKRKVLLWTSVAVNLGILGFFKYYNFFIENFIEVFSIFGVSIQANTLNIILPVGISFYTFQTLSYTIDVYKRKLEPTKDFLAFTAFVSFFPQLVAGPIERASNLLPQITNKRTFDYSKSVDGLRQILWGLIKKMVIADNCAVFANQIFANSADYNGSTLILGAFFFTIQIYADFSGYSDIAIGSARLFGINLRQNFAFPYFSRNFAEVWQRWHISLTTWFRDYLFIPMVRNSKSTSMFVKIRALFLQFIIIGFWHGANWTFILWGVTHAIFFLPNILKKKKKKSIKTKTYKYKFVFNSLDKLRMIKTFALITFSMIIFRAESVQHAFNYISKIFSTSTLSFPRFMNMRDAALTLLLVAVFFVIEWFGKNDQYAIEKSLNKFSRPVRWSIYYVLVLVMFLFVGKQQEFIYFQF
ncbi:MBOAT family O-acyltransferase [Brumimicrobium mesophilum]|uniref:MBOAT family O-acyltransferase n=1 Tax=Brumimicrobium mesophilum TaxID=392717 RepID=UPI000D140F09|nr:MBOAT family O-acyltransferase [Brumimicrobium mesophilum]